MNATEIKPGKLVQLRDREWVVLPSADKDILKVKPLGGSIEETAEIFLPFSFENEKITEVYFPKPSKDDIGDLHSAKLLYDAVRLSFRDAAGPFRSIAKYNFTPRAYQMVPLIMALKQEYPIRLFIADDVGIGKTIESLMIAREMLDRGVIKRFAVICLPHLCDQWQKEIKEKFGLDAVIFRSSSAAKLNRQVPVNQEPLEYFPFQVVSIDYMKSATRVAQFINNCPEMIIVDEVHTAATDKTKSKQQRHELIKRIAKDRSKHMILLSATPHSGKSEQFQSLLGLLHPSFLDIDMGKASRKQKQKLAQHYVQRRRADVIKWEGVRYNQTTTFPEKENYEVAYKQTPRYLQLQQEIMGLAKSIATEKSSTKSRQTLRYWTALGLIRGVMSSPEMGVAMLEKRAKKVYDEEEEILLASNPNTEDDYGINDASPSHLITEDTISNSQWSQLKSMSSVLEKIIENNQDAKIEALIKLIKKWHEEGLSPIVYCRFIKTAEYVGRCLKAHFKKKASITVVTSQDPDEMRKEKVGLMEGQQNRVLVATDCMSEGINLQELFTAVIHYDLPWNPNRLEQREGRVDRFGQAAPVVKTALLYGEDNPMDGIVLKVLLQKAREIKKAIGISVPFPENNQSIMETVTRAILIKGETAVQGSLFSDQELLDAEANIDNAYSKITDIEEASRSMYAQHSIKAQEIENDLIEALRLIGDMEDVESFVVNALQYIGADIQKKGDGYILRATGLPYALSHLFKGDKMMISFRTPAPEGYDYVARNHPLVDNLCQILLSQAMANEKDSIARSSIVRTSAVEARTTVVLMRVRNVIESMASKNQIVAEELLLFGYRGFPEDGDHLDEESCMTLLQSVADGELMKSERIQFLQDTLSDIEESEELLRELGKAQAQKLVEAHDRFRAAVRGKQYQVVEPILPMDVMGIYVFVPKT